MNNNDQDILTLDENDERRLSTLPVDTASKSTAAHLKTGKQCFKNT